MFKFKRRPWSPFSPDITYAVSHDDKWIGDVARFEGKRRWHASNITWTGGREFEETFKTRGEAAAALYEEARK